MLGFLTIHSPPSPSWCPHRWSDIHQWTLECCQILPAKMKGSTVRSQAAPHIHQCLVVVQEEWFHVCGRVVGVEAVGKPDIVGCNQCNPFHNFCLCLVTRKHSRNLVLYTSARSFLAVYPTSWKGMCTCLLSHFRTRTVGERKHNKPMLSPLISLGFSIARRNASIWEHRFTRASITKSRALQIHV